MITLKEIAQDYGLADEDAYIILEHPIYRRLGLSAWQLNPAMETFFRNLLSPHALHTSPPTPQLQPSSPPPVTSSDLSTNFPPDLPNPSSDPLSAYY